MAKNDTLYHAEEAVKMGRRSGTILECGIGAALQRTSAAADTDPRSKYL
jgi:hypothetical protein